MNTSGSHRGELIYRKVADEDVTFIRDIQHELRHVDSFIPQRLPHVTLLGRSATKFFSARKLDTVVYPLPSTADDTLRMSVTGVSVHRSPYGSYYVASLYDPDGQYGAEHHRFVNRARMHLPGAVFHTNPHVTIGCIDPRQGEALDGESLRLMLPDTITFDPIETTHVSQRDRVLESPRSRAPLKIHRPHSVPPLFLGALAKNG